MTSGKKVLVVGATGYLGSSILFDLHKNGVRVSGTSRGGINFDFGQSLVKFDFSTFKEEMIDQLIENNDIFIYAASTISPRNACLEVQMEESFLRLFLSKIASRPTKYLMHLSSAGTVYGENSENDLPWSESDKCRPVGKYGIFKLIQEKLIQDVLLSHQNYSILRISNPYGFVGSRDLSKGICRASKEAISAGNPISIFGNGFISRDFIYIDDLLEVIRLILKTMPQGEILNVCSGIETTFEDLMLTIYEVAGTSPALNFIDGDSGILRVNLSSDKLVSKYNFFPNYTLKEGLQKYFHHSSI